MLRKRILGAMLYVPLFLSLYGCSAVTQEKVVVKPPKMVEITTKLMEFDTAEKVSSGWTTFKYINRSDEPHFFLLDKYPEGKTIDDGKREVIKVFQEGMDLLNNGKADDAIKKFGELPAWSEKIIFSGGSGLVSAKTTALTTVKLEPGYYVIECYVKNAEGVFHAAAGMARQFIVTEEANGSDPPKPDGNITISSKDGISLDKPIGKGNQTIAVHFEDQIKHEHFVGHDINLVKVEEGANLDALEKWLDWRDPKGLISPPPKGFTFLGGVNDLPLGRTGYFESTFEPGKYLLVSEVPESKRKGMFVEFTVPE